MNVRFAHFMIRLSHSPTEAREPGAAWPRVERSSLWLGGCAAGAALWLHWPGALLLVLAPVVEELLFRAGLQEALLRRGSSPWAANGLATLAFALLHGVSRSWPLAALVVLPSLLLGRVYQQRRSLAHVVALHSAMNVFWLAFSSSASEFSFRLLP